MSTPTRGRPSSAQHPALRAIHLDTGAAIAWSDGSFAGDPDLVAAARFAVRRGREMQLAPMTEYVISGDDTPDGAAAAMLAARPGRMMLLDVPPSLALTSETAPFDGIR